LAKEFYSWNGTFEEYMKKKGVAKDVAGLPSGLIKVKEAGLVRGGRSG